MTTATDELRKLLDERGEDYTRNDFGITWSYYTDPHTATESMDGTLIVTGLTPEQAIAATLGSEREKRLEKLVQDMDAAFIHDNCYRWCEPEGPCNLITDGKCQYRERMKELGIEVIADER